MSHMGEKVADFVDEREDDLFLDWLEESDKLGEVMEYVLNNNKLKDAFYAWAYKEAEVRLQSVPDRDYEPEEDTA